MIKQVEDALRQEQRQLRVQLIKNLVALFMGVASMAAFWYYAGTGATVALFFLLWSNNMGRS